MTKVDKTSPRILEKLLETSPTFSEKPPDFKDILREEPRIILAETFSRFLLEEDSPEEAEKVIDPQTLVNYTRERIENQKTLELLEKMAKNLEQEDN